MAEHQHRLQDVEHTIDLQNSRSELDELNIGMYMRFQGVKEEPCRYI